MTSHEDVARNAATTVWAATSPQLAAPGGVSYEDCDIAELRAHHARRVFS
jgi:hypothetical protein